jgi:hypothetical protein
MIRDYRNLSYGLPNPFNYTVAALPKSTETMNVFKFDSKTMEFDTSEFDSDLFGEIINISEIKNMFEEIYKLWHSFHIYNKIKKSKKIIFIIGTSVTALFLLFLLLGIGVMQANGTAGSYILIFSSLFALALIIALICAQNHLPNKLNRRIKKSNAKVDELIAANNQRYVIEKRNIRWRKGQNMNWLELHYGEQDSRAVEFNQMQSKIHQANNAKAEMHFAFSNGERPKEGLVYNNLADNSLNISNVKDDEKLMN